MTLPAKSIATPSTCCSNPNCNEPFDLDKATAEIQESGIVYADCGDAIFQGYKCTNPECRALRFVSCDRNNPVFDLQNFIIIPNLNPYANVFEQLMFIKDADKMHEFLKFKFIPAWDEEKISIEDFPDKYNRETYGRCCMIPEDYRFEVPGGVDPSMLGNESGLPDGVDPSMVEFRFEIPEGVDPLIAESLFETSKFVDSSWASRIAEFERSSMGIPYLMKPDQFQRRLKAEFDTGIIHLRRLYPDIPKYRSLLICLAPNRDTEIDESGNRKAEDDGSSAKEFEERKSAWRALIEECGGNTLAETIIGHLDNKGIVKFDKIEVNKLIDRELINYRRKGASLLRELTKKVGFEKTIWDFFKKPFKEIFYTVCTELALAPQRKKLTEWVDKAEKGKALFVDAPMGLGKTYSTIEALADNPELSAVIFMPTKKLCEELIFNLKGKIAAQKGYDYWAIYQNTETVKDKNGNDDIDRDGYPRLQFRRDWLNEEVYYADGINKDECPFFDEFVNRYSYGWFTKNNVCGKCEKFLKSGTDKIVCRFRLHRTRAPLARIIITTHLQYNNFCKQSSMGKWYKHGYHKMAVKGDELVKEKIDGVERNFFIVDEDIILSRFYQPQELKKKQLKGFIATTTDFIADLRNNNILKVDPSLISNINQILAQFGKCDKTSIVPPIDSEFKIPQKIKMEWYKSYAVADQNIPEFIEWSGIVGNHLDVIEHAIKYGFVVQSYDHKFHSNGQPFSKKIKKAYFPNPNSLDISSLPPHVFFDGTKIGDKFIKHKMKNVEILKHEIDIGLLWNIQVFQNVNTDLPKSQMDYQKLDVQRFLSEFFNELGQDHKYFIVCSKATEDEYIEDLIEENFSDFNIILKHYRNLRGINDAKDCDTAIMLGSFIPPDAVEIAMGIEFIQDQLKPNKILPTENNVWKRLDSNFRMTYNKEYSVIGELAKYFRHSEHMQALARTRYIFHDVDFYIISKDKLSEYDVPYLSNIKTDQYKNHIFPGMPKFKHPASKNEDVLGAVIEWFSETDKETVRRVDICQKTGIRAGTVGSHLKHLVESGILEMASATKYKLASHLIMTNGNIEPRN